MLKHPVFDIETDGLLDQLTRVHCLVLRDVTTGDLVSCTDASPNHPPITHGLTLLEKAEKIYGHNVIGFDIPAILKVYPRFKLPNKVLDTFVTASMRWAHQRDSDFIAARAGKFPARFAGAHGLEAWGHRLGLHKGEYKQWCKDNGIEDAWETWRPEMQTYCELDTEVNVALVHAIKTAGGLSSEAVEIEHQLAWYLAAQMRNGVPFDVAKAQELHATLAGRREELRQQLVAKFGQLSTTTERTFTPKVNNKARGYVKGVPVTVSNTKTVEFNPNSTAHVERCLREHYNWEPKVFTNSGQASITEETLDSLSEIPEAALIQEFLLTQKRLGMVTEGRQAWMGKLEKHPTTGLFHIHGRVKQNAAITHRATHVSPNLAQVPKVLKNKQGEVAWGVDGLYGAECRSLFRVPEGWVMIGSDASGLELRCLAHYMARWDKGEYAKVVLEGDIHTVNMKAAGLQTRDQAKTFIYAFLYGEGDLARGEKFVPPGSSDKVKIVKGKAISRQFRTGLPALGKLMNYCAAQTKKEGGKGYFIMPDGRRTYIRHAHAALNSLLQSAGAIICKRWIVDFSARLTERFGPQGWEGKWVALLWIHDEVQLAVRPEIADEVQQILVDSIRNVTTHYDWRLPLDGEAKTGATWKDTH